MRSHRDKTIPLPRVPHTGLWLVILFPTILNGFCFKHPMEVSGPYHLSAGLALSTLLSSFCWFYLTQLLRIPGSNMEKLYGEDRKLIHVIIIVTISAVLMIVHDKSWLNTVLLVIISHVAFVVLCKYMMSKASSSFTLGEMYVVSQGVVVFSIISIMQLMEDIRSTPVNEAKELTSILQVSFLYLELSILLLINFPSLRKTKGFILIFTSFVFCELTSFFYIYQMNAISWIINFVLISPKRVMLVLYWLSLCALAIVLTVWPNSHLSGSVTVKRKYFHVLISAVYIPGVIFDVQLLYLSSAMVLCLLILVECCRVLHLQPLDTYINRLFVGYVDEKDTGVLILSPIYLLVGCTFPLWLWYTQLDAEDLHNQRTLFLLSGVLSLGVGDAAAAVGGTNFGVKKWPGTKKTYIGTMCCVVSQLAVILLLYLGGLHWVKADLQKFCLAISITSVAEAWTNQVDNLALPLIMMSILAVLL